VQLPDDIRGPPARYRRAIAPDPAPEHATPESPCVFTVVLVSLATA
jgi:hypothetical protein